MKIKLLLLTLFILAVSSQAYSQFDKPSFQIGVGISEPYDELKGNDYVTYDSRGFIYIDSNFIGKNYAGKTGFQIFGSGKINFDKYSIIRGVGFLGFNSFNSFESSNSGLTGIIVGNDTLPTSVVYDYGFTNFAIGFGLEVAPLSFTNVVSPFFNANLSLNFMGGEVTRAEGVNDTNRYGFNGFRIGVNFNTGIEVKVNKSWGIVAGIKYDLGNLLLKNTDQSISGRVEWGRTNGELNDESGKYYSNLSSPLGGNFKQYDSDEKKVNWGTIYLGVNFYPNLRPTSKK